MNVRMPNFGITRLKMSVAVGALSLGISGVAHAQKIAWLDMQQAMLATSDGKKAAAAIEAKFTPVKADLEKLDKQITDKQDAYAKSRSTMTPAAAQALQQEIQSLTTQLQRKQQDAQQDLQDEENKQFGPLMPRLTQAVNGYAAANQIILVIDSSAQGNNLLVADKSLNIIEPVVQAYEKLAGAPAPAASGASPTAPAAKQPASSTPAPKTATPGK